jgi:hypothetical protein
MDIWLELINCDYIYLFKFIFTHMCMIEKNPYIININIIFLFDFDWSSYKCLVYFIYK